MRKLVSPGNGPSDKGSSELLGFDTWCNACTSSLVSILPPSFPASQGMAEVLEWTASNANFLVKEVSKELAQFPEAEEVLFLGLAFKKWRFGDPKLGVIRRKAAIEGFIERNRRAESLRSADPITRAAMRKLLARWLPFVGVKPGRFGPGAVAEHISHARRWEVMTPWLERGYREDPAPCSGPNESLYLCMESIIDQHDTSRLCAVPKDWNKDRLITVEPTTRSFHQQSVRSTILASVHAGPLRGSAMDLFADGQAIQRRLALRASKDRTLSTLDLSDASDNITAEFVFDVFPIWVTTLLEQCRSPYFCTPEERSSDVKRPLAIYAGMGNATTFVIETLLFAAYCRAIAWRNGLRGQTVSVFGDDIIVGTDLHRCLLEMNDDFFRINEDKSFGPGDHLRESCGIYALDGRDITPPRINGFPRSFSGKIGLCEYVNNCLASHLAYRIRFGTLLAEAVLDQKLVPNWPFGIEGFPSLSIPWRESDPLPATRIHKDYQYREAQVSIPTPSTFDVPARFSWALQGALAGALTTRAANGRLIFPLRGEFKPPRKRWLRVI